MQIRELAQGIRHYQRPSASATIAAGATDTTSFRFTSSARGVWGIASVLVQRHTSQSEDVFLMTMQSGSRGRRLHFRNVHAESVSTLYACKSLLAPILIPPGEEVTFSVTNLHPTDAQSLTIALEVYAGKALRELYAHLASSWPRDDGKVPQVEFAYVESIDLAAGATSGPITATHLSREDLFLNRIGLGAYTTLGEIRVRISNTDHLLWPDVSAFTVAEYYRDRDERTPFAVSRQNAPVLDFTNGASSSQSISAIIECYRWAAPPSPTIMPDR